MPSLAQLKNYYPRALALAEQQLNGPVDLMSARTWSQADIPGAQGTWWYIFRSGQRCQSVRANAEKVWVLWEILPCQRMLTPQGEALDVNRITAPMDEAWAKAFAKFKEEGLELLNIDIFAKDGQIKCQALVHGPDVFGTVKISLEATDAQTPVASQPSDSGKDQNASPDANKKVIDPQQMQSYKT